MAFKMYSWNNGNSSKLLAEALGIKRIKHGQSRYIPHRGDILLNWGSSSLPRQFDVCRIINLPGAVANVTNKLTFFKLYRDNNGFNIPTSFYDRAEASEYLANNPGATIVARTVLQGSEGKGIVLASVPDELPHASLYTLYIKKKAEYRVHVAFGKVIDAVQKKRRAGHTEGDTRIRNTANGFVFARTDVVVPQPVLDSAVASVKFYGLDFGAVDVVWNEYHQKAYVLEINTAPGIEGTTVRRYADTFKQELM